MNARWWLLYQGLPVAVLLLPFVWLTIVGDARGLKGELGVVENLTVVFLLIAIGYCVAALLAIRGAADVGGLKAWLVLLIIGSAYFALEELSYGQHLIGWTAPETWAELNDQQETNLHNVHRVFDQLPRNLLSLGIFVGGVWMPLYRNFRKIELVPENRFYWQWPTMDCLTAGLIATLVRPVIGPFEPSFIDVGETKENFIALFILLYCISLYTRIKHEVASATAVPTN